MKSGAAALVEFFALLAQLPCSTPVGLDAAIQCLCALKRTDHALDKQKQNGLATKQWPSQATLDSDG